MIESLVIRQVDNPQDAALAGFGKMQEAAYFAPETLIPGRYIPQLLANPERNFLVVAELEGRVVAGTLFHWLADAGAGFSSFLGVERGLRGQGIARRLHQRRFEVLDRAAGGQVAGVFIDVVNPLRMPPEELEREHTVGSDSFDRRRAFAHLGFRQVDIRYEQPIGGPNGGPVTILDLLFCPHEAAADVLGLPKRAARRAKWVPTALVVATMRAYWTPWFGKDKASRYALELESRANQAARLKLISPEPT
jgi:GNAT superfamily N-acetyltransferase